MSYHDPVLLTESVAALQIKPDGVYVDATFGGGGHSRKILEQLGPKGILIAFDQDKDALANLSDDKRLVFVQNNFRHLRRYLRLNGILEVDGILADLGVSSHQIDEGARGFSYRFDAELDMRMNQDEPLNAATVLNTYDAEALQKVFGEWGEVRNARTLAQAIVQARRVKNLETIGDLLRIAEPLYMGQKMRYLSQVFQAIRIEVNDEMGALREFLEASLLALKPGGRLVVITYHSLEDRPVKNFLKSGDFEGNPAKDFYGNITRPFEIITKKAVEPGEAEIRRNPRARSAKLRVGEKKE